MTTDNPYENPRLPWETPEVEVEVEEARTLSGETLSFTHPRTVTAALLAKRDEVLDETAVEAILEAFGGNAGLTAQTTANARDRVLAVVRRRADERRRARVERLDGEDPGSPSEIRREVVGASDDSDVLAAFAGVFSAGSVEAKGIAGDLLDEIPGRGGKPRASIKVADGQGQELTLTRSKRTEVVVDVDAIVDVVTAHLIARMSPVGPGPQVVGVYADGVREGIAAFREVLSTTPGFRSTALDLLVRKLEDADDDALARRLRKAYGRVEKGEPSVKIERKLLAREEGDQ